jgi:hypothetical protein
MMDEDLRVKYLQGKPSNITVEQKFRLILRLLREQFPPEYPVKVRRVEAEVMARDGYTLDSAPWGKCWLVNDNTPKSEGKRYFLIQLHKAAAWRVMFDTLLHEWAHALTWNLVLAQDRRDHGNIFHKYFGRMYRAFVED